jgi:hypothetical protein
VANVSLESRVAQLEQQLAKLQNALSFTSLKEGKDWRRTIGMFTDDPEMMSVFDEARKLREADRRKAKTRTAKRRKSSQ